MSATIAELEALDPGNFVEITLGSAEMLSDVHATLAQWATRRPFYVLDDGIPLVICGRYADVRDVMLDDELFPSGMPHKRGFEKFDKFLGVQTMAQLDGEVHMRLRRLINPAFSPKAMLRLEAGIEVAVDRMLDSIEAGGPEFDGMADYAGLLLDGALLTVMLQLTPEQKAIFLEMHRLIPLTTHVKAGESVPQECIDAFARARETILAVVAERRAHPGEDFISDLIVARDDDDRLTDTELFNVLFTVCVAALSGTARAMGGVLYSLFRHPDQLAEVRADPGLARLAIEECLRFHRGGYFVFPRMASRDTEIGGTKIYQGMVVRASQQAANFDPTVYPEPLRFDIHRDPKHIMSFGVGPHQCVGNRLARMAMRVALVRLLARFPAVQLVDPGFEAEYGGAIGELRIKQLPMTIRLGLRSTGEMTASGEQITSGLTSGPGRGASQVVLATDRDGAPHPVALRSGQSLMRTLKYDGGLDIEAICGGNAICGTCHVYVDTDWYDRLPEPEELEAELLDQLVFTTSTSRLACQVRCAPDLAGLRVTLAPQE